MKKIIIFLCLSTFILPQEKSFNFNSHSNIKSFADHLFCSRDYIRAVSEFERCLNILPDDTIKFKLGLSYQKSEDYINSADIFKSMGNFLNSRGEYFNSIFKSENFESFRKLYSLDTEVMLVPESVNKQYLFSFFFTEGALPDRIQYEKAFNKDEQVVQFYERKMFPEYKSEFNAALLSGLIPGAGKIYTEQYGDGITAFISTLLMAYLSYDNFNAGHKFRGWLFGGLTAFFYAGNIYGSAASAQIYNAGVRLSFENDLKLFLNEQNYFMPDYNFCK